MKKQIIYILGLIVLAVTVLGGFYKYKEIKKVDINQYETGGNQTYSENGVKYQKYWNEDYGISFSYRLNPEGYILVEQDASALSSTQDIEKFLSLYDKKEYAEYKAGSLSREMPRSINIRIFKNPNNMSAQEWVNNNSAVANYRPGGVSLENISYGGVDGVRYNASGLYQNGVVVLNNNYKIYIFNVEYDSPSETILSDFQSLLNSLIMF